MMRLIWCCIVLSMVGCGVVPNRLEVFPDRGVGSSIDKPVYLLVKGPTYGVSNSVNNLLRKRLSERGILLAESPDAENMRLVVDAKNKKVQWVAYRDGLNTYYTEIDQLHIKLEMMAPGQEQPYFMLNVAYNAQLFGATGSGYKDKETLGQLVARVSDFVAKLYTNVNQAQRYEFAGVWKALVDDTKIYFSKNADNNGLIATIDQPGEGVFGFSKGEAAYKINSTSEAGNVRKRRGSYKVHYLRGGEPSWLPATYTIYGCVLVIDPITRNAPVGKSFYFGECG